MLLNKKKIYINNKIYILIIILFLSTLFSCRIYTFKDVSFPPDIKTAKLNFFENKARYINPQFAPKLNERLQQKIVSQTPLKRSTSDEADYVISGYISDYSVSTSGVTNGLGTMNNLNISIHIVLKNNKAQKEDEYDVNKAIPFQGARSLQEVENAEIDNIVKAISDEIFNRLFSNW